MAAPVTMPPQFGRYRIIQSLGAGGMGAVYLAEDTLLSRKVALKVPHFTADDGPNVLQRFLREARTAAAIDHPNLCAIYDTGEVDGTPYLVMPFIEGKPLSRLIDDEHPWPADQALALVKKLALALQVLHERGMIHRDLKPSNVMIRANGEPVVMDFGLARSLAQQSRQLTRMGAMLGTPAHMAPEQVLGELKQLCPATDVYGLGVILYELLTGHLPFEGPPTAVCAQILHAVPEAPSARRPGLESWLDTVCLKALAKKGEERHATMTEFARALERAVLLAPTLLPTDPRVHPTNPSPRSQEIELVALTVVTPSTCPKCGTRLTVPLDVDVEQLFCPRCQTYLTPAASPLREMTNSINMKFVLIPAGKFLMGSPKQEEYRSGNETQHAVEITKPFYLDIHKVTQDQYRQVMGKNPSYFSDTGPGKYRVKGLDTRHFPVENVCWKDAQEYCEALSNLPDEKKSGRSYRLPTEAEWEYSCRGGAASPQPFHFGNSLSSTQANFNGKYPYGGVRKSTFLNRKNTFLNRTSQVGSYPSNTFGLFDMHGNVCEWCQDRYAPYDLTIPKDPSGPANSPDDHRVLRGGSWDDGGWNCRSAGRDWYDTGGRFNYIGFRVICVVRTP